jgi:hypothetical protein
MPLLQIICPQCRHVGYIAADRLSGMLRCSSCGFVHLVRDGGRRIRSTDAERLNHRAPKSRRGKRRLVPGEQHHKPEAA